MANRANFAEPTTSTGTKTKNFQLEKGKSRFRIGPAFGALAASGRWNLGINQHYGYRSSPTEQFPDGLLRTFICTCEKDRKTKMVKRRCGECEDIEILAEKIELREQKLIADGKDQEEIDTILKAQKKYLKDHNLSKRNIVIAKNEAGEWGILWMAWKALEALIERRKTIKENNSVDILSINEGCWVEFNRTGERFNDTAYACDVVYEIETINGKKMQSLKQEPLTDADFDAIESSCPELTNVGTKLTEEQIDRLVESKGDPEVVDAIFNEAWDKKKNQKEGSAAPERSPAPPSKPAQKPVTKPVVTAEATTKKIQKMIAADVNPPTAEDDEEAALLAQLEAARKKKAAAAAAKAAKDAELAQAAAEANAEEVAEQDEDPSDPDVIMQGRAANGSFDGPMDEPQATPPKNEPVNAEALSDDDFLKTYRKRSAAK